MKRIFIILILILSLILLLGCSSDSNIDEGNDFNNNSLEITGQIVSQQFPT